MRTLRLCFALLAGSVTLTSAQQQPDVNQILAQIRASDKGQLAVSEEDGKFLRLMIASTNRKRVLEIGGASGYSAIWMAQGLRATGGRLGTNEKDSPRGEGAGPKNRRARLH